MKTEKPKKLIRWYILGAIGAVLMAAGTGCWGAFRFRKPTPAFSTEPVICLALMGCGGPCLPLDWERLGAFSITLR